MTPTASGKSLCYDLPVLQAVIDDPSARALYLFPTKALGQDQLAGLRAFAELAGVDLAAGIYDGDTPAPVRQTIRAAGQVVVTNPDMLHAAILPHHTKWYQLFEQLRFIVVDEAHTYRGVFGSHVANVLRRLLRLCAHYGSHPVIVTCSATIGNPQELAEALTGRRPALVDRNGAPAGEKRVLVLNPPVVDARLGIRAGALRLAERCALAFLRADRQTIVFGGSRHAVELMLTRLRDALREGRGPVSRVRGYRSGYLPTERRAIERGLRSGEVLGVVSTNALELGLDIGRLDAAVLAGYPGSIAATWQRIGRAGRRLEPSAAILVATSDPVDQYVAAHPDLLFESSPEEARLDPENLHILLAHLRAATFELPFEPGERFGQNPADDLLAFLGEEGHVRQAADGRWYWASENFPASEVSLRVRRRTSTWSSSRPVARSAAGHRRGRPLLGPDARPRGRHLPPRVAPVPRRSARLGRAEGVRPTGGRRLLHAGRAVGHPQAAGALRAGGVVGGERAHGEVMVSSIATIYKKLRLETLENLGWGRIFLPEIELHTTAYWLALEPEAVADWRRDELDLALVGAGRAMQTVASIMLMSDPRDLGLVSQVRSPHAERPVIYLYDGVPGGVGLAARLFQRHEELVRGAATSSPPAAA